MEWKTEIERNEDASALVHVGFWRPNTDSFDLVCSRNMGRVLLTGTAKLSLPKEFLSAGQPCAVVDNLPIYLALTGWGYEIDEKSVKRLTDSQMPEILDRNLPNSQSTPSDWLNNLKHELPELFEECNRFSIMSESQYQQKEYDLPASIRNRLGAFRYKALAGYPHTADNMVIGLQYTPPWILHLPIHALGLNRRIINCLKVIGIETVSDIARVGEVRLLRSNGVGYMTISNISNAIYTAFQSGSAYCDIHNTRKEGLKYNTKQKYTVSNSNIQYTAHVETATDSYSEKVLEPSTLLEALSAAFRLISEREVIILRKRMGYNERKMTLGEISAQLGLSRERIRQIESKSVTRIKKQMILWQNGIKDRLARMLEGRRTPLPVLGLDTLDPWFTGVDKYVEALKYILDIFMKPSSFNVVYINGQYYVTMLRQAEWADAEKAAKALLASLFRKADVPSEEEIKVLIESQLVGRGEELRPLLWDTVKDNIRFSIGEDRERNITGNKEQIKGMIVTILSESEVPLHYSELTNRCLLRGYCIDVRRVHIAVNEVGLLLGRGIYGLAKHINQSSESQLRILREVEEILSATPGRQWHAGEIVDELEVIGFDIEGSLSKYDLNVILKSSRVLAYLGRMVWTAGTKNSLGSLDRMRTKEAIVALLQRQGSPMHASDIRRILSKERRFGPNFLIQQSDPLIRVGVNSWGILWRDIPINELQADMITEEIVDILMITGSGLHTSEIIPSLIKTKEFASKTEPLLLVSLLTRSQRVKSGKGGYVYLPEWEGSRRLTISEAVEKTFDIFRNGVTSSDVAFRASGLLGRDVAINTTTSMLMKIGEYDSKTGLWFHTENSEEALDEKD